MTRAARDFRRAIRRTKRAIREGTIPLRDVREQGLESHEPGEVHWNPYGPYWCIALTPAEAQRLTGWYEPLHGWAAVVQIAPSGAGGGK